MKIKLRDIYGVTMDNFIFPKGTDNTTHFSNSYLSSETVDFGYSNSVIAGSNVISCAKNKYVIFAFLECG